MGKDEKRETAEKRQDRSAKPGEGFVCTLCAGLATNSLDRRRFKTNPSAKKITINISIFPFVKTYNALRY